MPIVVNWLAGLFISYITAMPLGPVNIAVVDAVLHHRRREAILISMGSALAEWLYCYLAVMGLNLLFYSPKAQEIFFMVLEGISIPLLITLGVLSLRKRTEEPTPTKEQALLTPNSKLPRTKSALLLGFMLNLFNPMIFTVWLTVSAYLINRKIIADSHLAMSVFAFGVALGTFLLHYSVAEFTARRHTGISPAMRFKINQGIGWLFIGFGVYAGWKLLEDIGAIAKMQAIFGG